MINEAGQRGQLAASYQAILRRSVIQIHRSFFFRLPCIRSALILSDAGLLQPPSFSVIFIWAQFESITGPRVVASPPELSDRSQKLSQTRVHFRSQRVHALENSIFGQGPTNPAR